jgi:hypothetical protein
VELQLRVFLTAALDEADVFYSDPFIPGKGTVVVIEPEVGCTTDSFWTLWRGEKILALDVNRTPFFGLQTCSLVWLELSRLRK